MKPILCFSWGVASNSWSITGLLDTSKRAPSLLPEMCCSCHMALTSNCQVHAEEVWLSNCGLQRKMIDKKVACRLNIESSHKFNEAQFWPFRWRNCWSKRCQIKIIGACNIQCADCLLFSWETLLSALPPSKTLCPRLTWISAVFRVGGVMAVVLSTLTPVSWNKISFLCRTTR